MLYDIYPAGIPENRFHGGPTVFDPAGASAGVVGFSPHLIFNITEKVVLFANVGYLTPQEDKNTEFNSLTSASISADWNVWEGLCLSAGYNYTGIDADDDSADDPRSTIATQLIVNF
jgi:hypothetical protein